MAERKTKENNASVPKFLNAIEDEQRRKDCKELAALMEKITGVKPKMWGDSIVGFGRFHYTYKSGREGDLCLTGFSPRKRDLTVYIMSGFKQHEKLLKKLGKFKNSVSCLYVKSLDDIHRPTLKTLITRSVKETKKRDTG